MRSKIKGLSFTGMCAQSQLRRYAVVQCGYSLRSSPSLLTGPFEEAVLVIGFLPQISITGAVWFLYLLGYNMNIGVWVGMIALLDVNAETGVFMLLYLDLAYDEAKREGSLRSLADLRQAIMNGAVKRLRPKFMTVAATAVGLVPIMWSMGTGADVMKRIAAPLIGGIFTPFALELIVYLVVYENWIWNFELKHISAPGNKVER